eukprot:GILK01006866.1.p1 GENE.GILK01006866.1~~GILK01006866.1.p1  ORF type:complete len:736 (+),score=122.25 GILK01006866.1:128-2335(+)
MTLRKRTLGALQGENEVSDIDSESTTCHTPPSNQSTLQFLTLKFPDPGVEREYKIYTNDNNRSSFTKAWIVLSVIIWAYSMFDALRWQGHHAIIVGRMICRTLFTIVIGRIMGWKFFPSGRWNTVLLVSVAGTALLGSMVAFSYHLAAYCEQYPSSCSETPKLDSVLPDVLLIISPLLFHLGFYQAVSLTIVLVLSYISIIFWVHNTETMSSISDALHSSALIVFALGVSSCVATFQNEKKNRVLFLESRDVRYMNRQLSAEVIELQLKLAQQSVPMVPTEMERVIRGIECIKNYLLETGKQADLKDKAGISVEDIEQLIASLLKSENIWRPHMSASALESMTDDTKRFIFEQFSARTVPSPTASPQPSIRYLTVPTRESLDISPRSAMRSIFGSSTPDNKQLNRLLNRVGTWSFNAFDLADACEGYPLAPLLLYLFSHYNLADQFQIKDTVLRAFAETLEGGYIQTNFYHNSTHAADVTSSIDYFLKIGELRANVTQLETMTAIVAAAAHDVAHPGLTNAFLVATKAPCAVTYNDISVLENMHCATLFRILAQDGRNIFGNLSSKDKLSSRKMMIAMILDTDLSRHFDSLGLFRAKVQGKAISMAEFDDRLLVLKMALKCADIAHGAKPLVLHQKWSSLITEEFFAQGDIERSRKLPISPFCDRERQDFAKNQDGFLTVLVLPLYQAWCSYLQVLQIENDCLNQIAENTNYWRSYADADKISTETTKSASEASC